MAPSPNEAADLTASPSELWRVTSRREIWLGWGLALAATAGFSIASPISRGAIVAGVDPTMLVMVRMVGAAIFASLVMASQHLHWMAGRVRVCVANCNETNA